MDIFPHKQTQSKPAFFSKLRQKQNTQNRKQPHHVDMSTDISMYIFIC